MQDILDEKEIKNLIKTKWCGFRISHYDWKKCIQCKHIFPVKKGKANKTPHAGVRSHNCKTCSKKCSVLYNRRDRRKAKDNLSR